MPAPSRPALDRVLYRLATAKRSDTRSRRLTTFVEMLARGETIYPRQRRPE